VSRDPTEDCNQAAADRSEAGLVTCTSRLPRRPRATYALAWLPLENPESFPANVRKRLVWETE
jgi:hypothetical protein